MKLSSEQFDIMMSNPKVKFEYGDIGDKIAYIPAEGDIAYINVDLEGDPNYVLMAILYALASITESKAIPGRAESLRTYNMEAFVEDLYVSNRYLKNLYAFSLLDYCEFSWNSIPPDAMTREVARMKISDRDFNKFVEVSMLNGCPFVSPNEDNSDKINSYGKIDVGEVIAQSEMSSDSESEDRGSNKTSQDSSKKYRSEEDVVDRMYEKLRGSSEKMAEALRMFFSSIMDRGKRYKLDSMKLYNRRSRSSDLIYSSISKKVLRSQNKLGILVDVSGSMDVELLRNFMSIIKDDILSVFDSDSLVLCWNTEESARYLISEVPSSIARGGGTNLSGGVLRLAKEEGCRTIVLYSDFEDKMELADTCDQCKRQGVNIYFCNPEALKKRGYRKNSIESQGNFEDLWSFVVEKVSSLGNL